MKRNIYVASSWRNGFTLKCSPSAQNLFMQQRSAAELSNEPKLSLDEINEEIHAAREEIRKRKNAK